MNFDNKESGNIAFREKRFLDALSFYERAVEELQEIRADEDTKNIQLSKVWNNKSACFIALEKWKEAYSCSIQCLRLDPFNVKALYRAAVSSEKLKLIDEALKQSRRGLTLEPSNKRLRVLHARLKKRKRLEMFSGGCAQQPGVSLLGAPFDAGFSGYLPKAVMQSILLHCDCSTLVMISQCSWWYLQAARADDLWENLFYRERQDLWLCHELHHSWLSIFRYSFKHTSESLQDALSSATDNMMVILSRPSKGVTHIIDTYGFSVKEEIHLLGCCYGRQFLTRPEWKSPDAVTISPDSKQDRHVIHGRLLWTAKGGSLRNVTLAGALKEENYAPSLRVHGSLQVENVRLTNSYYVGAEVAQRGHAIFVKCDFSSTPFHGLRIKDMATVKITKCLIRNNGACGVEALDTSQVTLSQCSIYGNELFGISTMGKAEVHITSSNLFDNKSAAVELRDSVKLEMKYVVVRRSNYAIASFTEAALTEEMLRRQFCTSGNIFEAIYISDFKCTHILPGSDAVESAIREGVCTFLYTGPHYFSQPRFKCSTCEISDSLVMCRMCATVHENRGHQVEQLSSNLMFCDCPSLAEKTNCCWSVEAQRAMGQRK